MSDQLIDFSKIGEGFKHGIPEQAEALLAEQFGQQLEEFKKQLAEKNGETVIDVEAKEPDSVIQMDEIDKLRAEILYLRQQIIEGRQKELDKAKQDVQIEFQDYLNKKYEVDSSKIRLIVDAQTGTITKKPM